jgi:NTP pyrophosphatase (non-canonical NTP hydrolase)
MIELNNNNTEITIVDGIDNLVNLCHSKSVEGGWWHDINTGKPLERNKAELMMLMVSEISEAMEADRKDLMDDKLPHRKGLEVELADAVIRIADFCGGFGLDLAGAILEKIEYNSKRADHKPENRRMAGGKKF